LLITIHLALGGSETCSAPKELQGPVSAYAAGRMHAQTPPKRNCSEVISWCERVSTLYISGVADRPPISSRSMG